MKKLLLSILTILFAGSVLIACNDDTDTTDPEPEETETEPVEDETETDAETDPAEEDAEEETTDGTENNEGTEDDSSGGPFDLTEEDQIDLRIGDTATVQTSIGTYELTVDAAEIVGAELDGVTTELEQLIVLDLTFNNVGDQPLDAEEIMSSLGITDYLEGSNSHNSASAYESIDDFEGELAPGEEVSTQFIADVYTAEEYYFRQNPGVVAAGTSNDVMWTITAEEAGQ